MNRLDLETQTAVIAALVEGSSIRSVERMNGVHREVDLHFAHYNLCRKHATLGATPAMAAGLATRPLTVRKLVELAS